MNPDQVRLIGKKLLLWVSWDKVQRQVPVEQRSCEWAYLEIPSALSLSFLSWVQGTVVISRLYLWEMRGNAEWGTWKTKLRWKAHFGGSDIALGKSVWCFLSNIPGLESVVPLETPSLVLLFLLCFLPDWWCGLCPNYPPAETGSSPRQSLMACINFFTAVSMGLYT